MHLFRHFGFAPPEAEYLAAGGRTYDGGAGCAGSGRSPELLSSEATGDSPAAACGGGGESAESPGGSAVFRGPGGSGSESRAPSCPLWVRGRTGLPGGRRAAPHGHPQCGVAGAAEVEMRGGGPVPVHGGPPTGSRPGPPLPPPPHPPPTAAPPPRSPPPVRGGVAGVRAGGRTSDGAGGVGLGGDRAAGMVVAVSVAFRAASACFPSPPHVAGGVEEA